MFLLFPENLPDGTEQASQRLRAVSLKVPQIPCSRAGERAQRLRALVLIEDLGPVLAPSWWLTVVYNSSFRGSDTLLQPPWALHACVWCTDKHVSKTLGRIK